MAVVYGIRSDNKCKRRVVAYNEMIELKANCYMEPIGTTGYNVGQTGYIDIPNSIPGDFYVISYEFRNMDNDEIGGYETWISGNHEYCNFYVSRNKTSSGKNRLFYSLHDKSGGLFGSGDHVEIRVLLMPKGE